jgi:hypothetical protein
MRISSRRISVVDFFSLFIEEGSESNIDNREVVQGIENVHTYVGFDSNKRIVQQKKSKWLSNLFSGSQV